MSANCQLAKIHGSPFPSEDAGAARTFNSTLNEGRHDLSASVRRLRCDCRMKVEARPYRSRWQAGRAKFHLSLAAAFFALSILFLLGACAASGNGKQDDPAVFGSASGANGGAGATTGLSFGW